MKKFDAIIIGAGQAGPTVGSFLYVIVASVAAGMTASAVRWAVIDQFHHRTGIVRPVLDESKLPERLQAFDYLVENHYRYYQFYGNTLVATVVAYAAWTWGPAGDVSPGGVAGFLALSAVFVAGSRDALRKYYAGSALLLGTLEQEVPHDQRQAPAPDPGPEPEPED